MFVVPLGVGARLKSWGVPDEKIKELSWKENFIESTLSITACPTIHYSGRGTNDKNKTLWCSYIIKGNSQNIFWSGDSGYGDIFKEIGEQYGPFDLACVEIDGWNDGWPNTHLFPEDVINVCKDMDTKKLLPIHWGVFDLALHPWNESIQQIYELSSKNEIELLTPKMGEKVILNQEYSQVWWND